MVDNDEGFLVCVQAGGMSRVIQRRLNQAMVAGENLASRTQLEVFGHRSTCCLVSYPVVHLLQLHLIGLK